MGKKTKKQKLPRSLSLSRHPGRAHLVEDPRQHLRRQRHRELVAPLLRRGAPAPGAAPRHQQPVVAELGEVRAQRRLRGRDEALARRAEEVVERDAARGVEAPRAAAPAPARAARPRRLPRGVQRGQLRLGQQAEDGPGVGDQRAQDRERRREPAVVAGAAAAAAGEQRGRARGVGGRRRRERRRVHPPPREQRGRALVPQQRRVGVVRGRDQPHAWARGQRGQRGGVGVRRGEPVDVVDGDEQPARGPVARVDLRQGLEGRRGRAPAAGGRGGVAGAAGDAERPGGAGGEPAARGARGAAVGDEDSAAGRGRGRGRELFQNGALGAEAVEDDGVAAAGGVLFCVCFRWEQKVEGRGRDEKERKKQGIEMGVSSPKSTSVNRFSPLSPPPPISTTHRIHSRH